MPVCEFHGYPLGDGVVNHNGIDFDGTRYCWRCIQEKNMSLMRVSEAMRIAAQETAPVRLALPDWGAYVAASGYDEPSPPPCTDTRTWYEVVRDQVMKHGAA